jgi:UDP-N-acetylglucosamine 2-epimerase (non-hydrolysing)
MKVAPLMRAVEEYNTTHQSLVTIHPLLIHTGQHYDYEMSKVFFEDLELPQPDIYLAVGSGTHAEQTGKIMIEFEKVLFKEKPDLAIVVGDVNSTLAAALAAVKLRIPVAHVEAGLRSYDRTMPEEINRLLTDAVSDYLFTPSPDADENLRKEGISEEKIFLVGNVMVDSLLYNKPKAEKSDILERLGLVTSHQSSSTPYALLTLHRPSNVDNKETLLRIIKALGEISRRIPIVFPAHPRTQKRLKEFDLLDRLLLTNHRLLLIEPLSYLDFLNLEMNAKFVMTDSGGIQEETTVLNIPCLTLRNTTERPITIGQGTNTLVWNNTETIITEAFKIIDGKGKKGSCPELWDGRTAERIVEILVGSRS